MDPEAVRRQIELCESTRGIEGFGENVETLLIMLPPMMRASIEADENVYKFSDGYINRFINNVLITVEFTKVRAFDHEALFAAIKRRLGGE
jgi:hypothetical protein